MKYVFTIEMKGTEINPSGYRVQMDGNGDNMQALEEIAALPHELGLLAGLLTKKVLFNNEAENRCDASAIGTLFANGFKYGVSDKAEAIDKNSTPSVTEYFKVRED